MAKLSNRQKANIKAKWDTGQYTKTALAKTYKVDEKVIRNVLNGRHKKNSRRNNIKKDILSKDGYVYIIRAGSENFFKIGITRNKIEKRLMTLQTGNPLKLSIIFYSYFIDVLKLEKLLHFKYKDFRLEGEWFRLTIDEVLLIIDGDLANGT